MKVVHVIARLNVGGAALSVLELARGQASRGHEVAVVAGRIPDGEESMEDLAGQLGVPYVRLESLQRELSPGDDVATTRRLRALIRQWRPDVLHTHTAKAGATGRVAAALAGGARPGCVVHTYHGHVLSGYFSPRRERAFRRLERMLALGTDALIAVSNEVRDDLVLLRVAPVEKFVVIPYGFNPDARVDARPETRAEVRAEIAAGPKTFVLGWAGRVTGIKRPLDLVRTLSALRALDIDALLVVVGDGEDRAGVERLAHDLDVHASCRFVGYTSNIARWYAAFDALLLTSANEGTPVVAIEALLAGRPVVATRAGGTATVVDDGETGFLAPVGDIATLATRLAQLATDVDLRTSMGVLGHERMRTRFSVERMVYDVLALYRRILG